MSTKGVPAPVHLCHVYKGSVGTCTVIDRKRQHLFIYKKTLPCQSEDAGDSLREKRCFSQSANCAATPGQLITCYGTIQMFEDRTQLILQYVVLDRTKRYIHFQ